MIFPLQRFSPPLSLHSAISVLVDQGQGRPPNGCPLSRSCLVLPRLFHPKTGPGVAVPQPFTHQQSNTPHLCTGLRASSAQQRTPGSTGASSSSDKDHRSRGNCSWDSLPEAALHVEEKSQALSLVAPKRDAMQIQSPAPCRLRPGITPHLTKPTEGC